MKITINNWREYNGRKDIKNPTWFRCENKLFFDPKYCGWSSIEFFAWMYLLGYASFRQKPTFDAPIDGLINSGKVTREEICAALQKLEEFECITVDVTDTLRTRDGRVTIHNETKRNVTKQDLTVLELPHRVEDWGIPDEKITALKRVEGYSPRVVEKVLAQARMQLVPEQAILDGIDSFDVRWTERPPPNFGNSLAACIRYARDKMHEKGLRNHSQNRMEKRWDFLEEENAEN